MKARQSKIKRHTLETRISIRLNLDGKGKAKIHTGIPFFDHMLTLFARHATVDLDLRCDGDLAVDAHHTVEDCGIALGQAVAMALGDKRGIRRYGWFAPQPPGKTKPAAPQGAEAYVPMDECLARCVVDFSGRPYLVWRGLRNYDQPDISAARQELAKKSLILLGEWRENHFVMKSYSSLSGLGSKDARCEPMYFWGGLLGAIAIFEDSCERR